MIIEVASLVAELDKVRVQIRMLEVRIHAQRLRAQHLLAEGDATSREVAARFIREADGLEADLKLVREYERRLAERIALKNGQKDDEGKA